MGQRGSPGTDPKTHWNLVLIEVASYIREVKMKIWVFFKFMY